MADESGTLPTHNVLNPAVADAGFDPAPRAGLMPNVFIMDFFAQAGFRVLCNRGH
jgi:hypothetical protein